MQICQERCGGVEEGLAGDGGMEIAAGEAGKE